MLLFYGLMAHHAIEKNSIHLLAIEPNHYNYKSEELGIACRRLNGVANATTHCEVRIIIVR